jgi:hypothetical protein
MFVPSKYFLPNLIFAGQELTQKGKSYCAELYRYVPNLVGKYIRLAIYCLPEINIQVYTPQTWTKKKTILKHGHMGSVL